MPLVILRSFRWPRLIGKVSISDVVGKFLDTIIAPKLQKSVKNLYVTNNADPRIDLSPYIRSESPKSSQAVFRQKSTNCHLAVKKPSFKNYTRIKVKKILPIYLRHYFTPPYWVKLILKKLPNNKFYSLYTQKKIISNLLISFCTQQILHYGGIFFPIIVDKTGNEK
jgi:hypothetical protein